MTVHFSIYLQDVGNNGTCGTPYNFCGILGILLNAHVFQFEINCDNHVEIHLTYRK
jgi:hypothetical protein